MKVVQLPASGKGSDLRELVREREARTFLKGKRCEPEK